LPSCLPNLAEDLTAYAQLARTLAGHHPFWGGKYGNTHARKNPWDLAFLGINPTTWSAYTLYSCDDRFTLSSLTNIFNLDT
jgi:hypothetical protein